ncbi:transposase, is4-like protein [Corallococcus coralloides DSM 2259]|uniref:Transposase, is4-like protein n=1 Tax=Corallococcus coralloides (strain ATCC 25202 / DSM 2259 / NBRC 100086 / M2) TaxID=1144275 RepID=H8N216_CORCM|nr:transposase, is4-like protein [Corallococcus coralloides DSM 2259]
MRNATGCSRAGKRKGRVSVRQKPLETLWEVPNELWERIEPLLLEAFPPAWTGRSRADWRKCFNGIIYQLRTGCQWNHLPRRFGSDRTVHRWFTKWVHAGVFLRIWSALVEECDELGEVHWRWQAVDGCLGKARMGGDLVGENPTDRAKRGTKKSLMVEEDGGPLSVVVAPANCHDSRLLKATLESIVVQRPAATRARPQHLGLDKAYDTPTAQQVVATMGYVSHTARINRGEWLPNDPAELKRWLRRRAARETKKKGGRRNPLAGGS